MNYSNRKFIFLSMLYFYCFSNIYPQIAEPSKQSGKDLLSRFRIINGVSGFTLAKNDSPALYYINVDYRTSSYSDSTNFFSLGFAAEPGINVVFSPENIKDVFILPYAKVGPEISLFKNMYLGANVGFVGFLSEGTLGMVTPVYGVNYFYLINITEKSYIELETGFHSPFQAPKSMFFYVAAGFSFR